MDREETASSLDVALFFASGVGCSISQIAILSSLVYWSSQFGANSFLILNLCIFSPLLVISIFQAFGDLYFDTQVGTLKAYAFRGCVGFVCGIICLACVVVAESLVVLCVLSTIVGLASAILFGTLNQMAAFLSFCGRLKMGFFFGYQASGLIVLMMSLSTGFGSSASPDGKYYFFIGCALIKGICFAFFLLLLFHRPNTHISIYQRDILTGWEEGGESAWIIDKKRTEMRNKSWDGWGAFGKGQVGGERGRGEEEGEGVKLMKAGGEGYLMPVNELKGCVVGVLSFRELWRKAKWCCLCVVVTVATSMCIGSWFTEVKTDSVALPQILFFTKHFSDTLGRPSTAIFSPSSTKILGVLCGVRVLIVPIFFLSASATGIPSAGWLLICLVILLSFSSGFLITSSYQLAPSKLDIGEEGSLSKLASLLNICFSAGCVGGILIGFILEPILS